MADALYGVRLKVARAEEHLEALRQECSTYLDSNTHELVKQTRSENCDSETPLVWKVNHSPPLRLSVLLGDSLHNLRSSLDHIAWQLVLANGGTPGRQTSFPIYPQKKGPLKISGGVSVKATALVESLQPYNNANGKPEEDPLHILNTLNNIDKHREFNIAILNVSDMLEARLLTEDESGIYMAFQFLSNVGKDSPITDGAVVGHPPFQANPGQKWAFGVQSRLGLQETKELSTIGSPSLYELAERLVEYVRDTVVPEFDKILK